MVGLEDISYRMTNWASGCTMGYSDIAVVPEKGLNVNPFTRLE